MFKAIAAAGALFLFAQPCLAQTPPADKSVEAMTDAPVDPVRLAAARRFMTAAHIDTAMNQVVAAMMPQMMRATSEAEHLTTDQVNLVSRVVLEQLQADTPLLIEMMARIYANRLSEADLDAATAFYQSEAGQHFIAQQGQLAQDGAAVGDLWAQRALPTVLGRIQALMQTPNFEHP